MHQHSKVLTVKTHGRGLYQITASLKEFLQVLDIQHGLLTLFCRHTSASLLITENADQSVLLDLESAFSRLAPQGPNYRHSSEGPDDMPAHIRAALTQTHLTIPVGDGLLALGKWQGVYLFEHRNHAHSREVRIHLMGE